MDETQSLVTGCTPNDPYAPFYTTLHNYGNLSAFVRSSLGLKDGIVVDQDNEDEGGGGSTTPSNMALLSAKMKTMKIVARRDENPKLMQYLRNPMKCIQEELAQNNNSNNTTLQKGKKKKSFQSNNNNTNGMENEFRNDYAQRFVDTGLRPQNYLREYALENRFLEFPKLRQLIQAKDALIDKKATRPEYLQCDLKTFDLRSLGSKFDVIYLDPPLKDYLIRSPSYASKVASEIKARNAIHGNVTNQDPGYWTWEEIAQLPIPDIASSPCFIFMWVGSGDGLDRGRETLAKWGFRRCEDIVWIKTNRAMDSATALQHPAMTRWDDTRQEHIGLFQQTKEHCLMGIKGTARRSTDSHLMHCNIDTDVIIAEEEWDGSPRKPEEIYHIMEHFCNGRRRLELFGEDHNIRRGWVTLGKDLSGNSGFHPRAYRNQFEQEPMGHLLGKDDIIEQLRPKTPPPGGR